MGRCREYWALAEAHADLFNNAYRHHLPLDQADGDEHLKAQRHAALQELDQHALTCPICRKE